MHKALGLISSTTKRKTKQNKKTKEFDAVFSWHHILMDNK
jgi:hypothetical protein